jgi:2-keto-4-pentenoate hydratase/2-oxohepta-3-ene-1,7-dioic acid hydratase in catechol pathway
MEVFLKLITFSHNGRPTLGAWLDGSIVDLSAVAPDMLTLIRMGAEGLVRARETVYQAALVLSQTPRLLAPIPRPHRNVVCLGLNYAEHAKESAAARGREMQAPDYPIFFTKATHTVIGPDEVIPFDAAVSEQLDWEAELGVIIGRTGKNIPAEQAMEYVFGYTCLNDISARDLQSNHRQFFKGKSLDGSCPLGPWIVTADEIADPHNLAIACRVNGVTKQESNTGQMIFDIPATIASLSRGMTLDPGDIIATGTPSGVGFARTPPEFLRPGDIVEVEVEGIGVLRNKVQ